MCDPLYGYTTFNYIGIYLTSTKIFYTFSLLPNYILLGSKHFAKIVYFQDCIHLK